MKELLCTLGLAILCFPAPVLADEKPKEVEVLERDAQGHAIRVKLDGFVMDVCTPGKTDGCVNPREIGLDQGSRPIEYWPGKPASEIDEPLPAENPGDEAD